MDAVALKAGVGSWIKSVSSGVIREVFDAEGNVRSPACFVVVRQPDPSDDRGDVIFDIFRMNAQSYLWHFNRVYTRPRVDRSN